MATTTGWCVNESVWWSASVTIVGLGAARIEQWRQKRSRDTVGASKTAGPGSLWVALVLIAMTTCSVAVTHCLEWLENALWMWLGGPLWLWTAVIVLVLCYFVIRWALALCGLLSDPAVKDGP